MKPLKKQILLFILLLSFALKGAAQDRPNFTFTPEKPTNGQTVSLSYDATGTPLEGKPNITAVVYQYKNYKWVGADLAFTGAANKWKADFKVPVDCGLIALKFKSDTTTDNNHDNGYFVMFHDKDREGKNAPGALVAWGLARSPKYQMDIPGYMNFKGISDTATYLWLSQEIKYNQDAKSKLVVPYSMALKNYRQDAATPDLNKAIAFLTRKGATEDELLKARLISTEIMGNVKLKDSIEGLITKDYPKGSLARLVAYRNISADRNMDAVLKASEKFLADFPVEKTNAAFDLENRINYGTVYQNIINLGGHMKKDDSYLNKYVNLLPYDILSTIFYKIVDIPYHRKDEADAALYTRAETLMKRYQYYLANQPENLSYLSPLEWKENWERERANFEFVPYIGLLLSAGKDEEAFNYTLLCQQYLNYKNATVNNYQAQLLKKKGDDAALNDLLKKSFFNNQATTEMLDMLKAAYVKEKGSENGFDAYVKSLKNPADESAAEKEALAGMINKQMPEWSMKDMDGKTVNSKALRGKTVVLDFWATWCVPCKASFPGMKLAVEKYKNEKDVIFYFVDTEERTATYKEEVKKYIKDNNYPFNVLFDNKVPGAKTTGEVYDKICKAFGISGIPQKLFIDKEGKLRFLSVGYNGSASGLADDISMLVELTKTVK